MRDYFRQELDHSACWISAGSAGIGAWRLENRDGRLVLRRYPPPAGDDMYIFEATLEPKNSGWNVTSFGHEREFGPE